MWVYHLLIIPLLLMVTVSRCEVDRSPSMLTHYWNLLSIGESWLFAKFDINSNGSFFLAKDPERRLEMGNSNKALFLNIPIVTKSGKPRVKRIVIDLDSVEQIGPIMEMLITFQHNHIHVYDGCDEVYAGFEQQLDLNLHFPKVTVSSNWTGAQPTHFSIGSGWPIGQKCKKDGVKKKYAESYSEEIEKEFQGNKNADLSRIFYETVVVPPENFEGCKIDTVLLAVGESRIHDCNQCTCLSRDNVVCRAVECPAVTCAHPVIRNGDCCPTCGQQCFHENHKIANNHGEIFWPGDCHRCQCWDTQITCLSELAKCEPPPCPEEDWVYNEKFNCCPKCRDFARFCDVKPCDPNATCTGLKRGPKCSCNTGFQGNGTHCEDIDECAFSQDAREQLGGCLPGSMCRNVPGSYKCDCLPGYQMIGENTCLPLIRV